MVKIATTLREALEFRSLHPCTIVAGGTDQYVRLRSVEGVPPALGEHVLYLSGIEELSKIVVTEDLLTIGATATLSKILATEETPLLLKQAIRQIGGPGIRNMATLAGNIANASPAADGVCALVALNASVELESLSKTRTVLVEDLITGVRKTLLQNNELITKILVPLKAWNASVFSKAGGRKADAISKVSLSGLARIEHGTLLTIRIALGAVAPKVVRDGALEARLQGGKIKTLDPELVAAQYAALISPIDDQRSDKHYRHDVAQNLVRTFIRTLQEGPNAQ